MSSNRGNRRRSLPMMQAEGRNGWSGQDLDRLTFVAAPSCLFRHTTLTVLMKSIEYSVLDPGIIIEIEPREINTTGTFDYFIPEEHYFIGIVMEIKGLQFGFRVLGDKKRRMFRKNIRQLRHFGWGSNRDWSLFILNVGVTLEFKELCKEECEGRITIPGNIMDYLNKDAERTGVLLGKHRTISAFGRIYKGLINGLAPPRVKIADNGQEMDDIWLDSKSEYIIPIEAESRDESAMFQDILKCWEDGKRLEREVALEFLDEWTGTFHGGVIRDCRPDGYITVVKVSEVVKRIRNEGDADGTPEQKYMFHYSSPCLLPYGFCVVMDSAAHGGLKACYGGIGALEYLKNCALPAPLDRLPHNQRNAPRTKFQIGMKLEVAEIFTDEKTNKHETCIRKGTVRDTWCRFLCISFDGWGSKHDKWISASSSEIYPVGWCALRKNKMLELVPDGVEDVAGILPEGQYRVTDPLVWNMDHLSEFFKDNHMDEVIPSQRQREIQGREFLGMSKARMRLLARRDVILLRKLVGLQERILAIAVE